MIYERLTKRCGDIIYVFDINDHETALNELKPLDIVMIVGRLTFLEDKIEDGTLVELPCIEPMTTWDWDDATGLEKSNFGKYWKIVYRDKDGELMVYMGVTKAEAEARLEELKGGRE